jgi:hypothetical protein
MYSRAKDRKDDRDGCKYEESPDLTPAFRRFSLIAGVGR